MKQLKADAELDMIKAISDAATVKVKTFLSNEEKQHNKPSSSKEKKKKRKKKRKLPSDSDFESSSSSSASYSSSSLSSSSSATAAAASRPSSPRYPSKSNKGKSSSYPIMGKKCSHQPYTEQLNMIETNSDSSFQSQQSN